MSEIRASWDIERTPWDVPEWQEAYGDDATVVITANGKEVLWCGVTEIIDGLDARFVLSHVLSCIRQGVFPAADEATCSIAGEISAIAHAALQRKRSRKARSK